VCLVEMFTEISEKKDSTKTGQTKMDIWKGRLIEGFQQTVGNLG